MLLSQHELTIRPAQPTDAAQLAAWWNDGAVMAHAGFPQGLGISVTEVEAQLRQNADGIQELFVVEENGRSIGEMNYRAASVSGVAEIGIKLCAADCQNRGLGKRLLRLLIAELFRRGFTVIELTTAPENVRACHVYERLGFVRLRVERDCWTDQLGRPRSAVLYRLTPEQFAANQPNSV